MHYTTSFNVIIGEGFSPDVALLALLLRQLNMTKTVTVEHMRTSGSYTKELISTFRCNMVNESPETIEEAIKVWEVLCTYESCQEMVGHGGCVARTIRELIAMMAVNAAIAEGFNSSKGIYI